MRIALIFFTTVFVHAEAMPQDIFKRTLLLMGSRFEITVVDRDSIAAAKHIDAAIEEIRRIEGMISSWNKSSETSAINRNAGMRPTKVSPELYQIIERSLEISKLTDGAFDITFASMDRIWKFDGSMKEMPTHEEIEASVAKVGYENIALNKDEQSVFLKISGMKIGFGAIGKGYAADKAKDLLMDRGVEAGIINASGDMNAWGVRPDGEPWKVAITNPLNKANAFGLLPLNNEAVVTSGSYEKFVEFDGVRYSHIIDPKSGYPATGIISTTVFAPRAELADALATAVFVMGIEAGIDRIDQLPGVECIIIDESGGIYKSKNIEIQTQ